MAVGRSMTRHAGELIGGQSSPRELNSHNSHGWSSLDVLLETYAVTARNCSEML